MPAINWVPLISFLLITALSPGPNNLSCVSMGVQHGYKRSLIYIMGIVFGMIVQSLLSGLISTTLFNLFPKFETVLRVIGAAYILWLAYITLNSSYATDNNGAKPLGFKDGFLLQFLNVKAILFVLTVYTAYLQPILGNIVYISVAALLLGLRSFLVNSTWAVFGSTIRRFLRHSVVNKVFNITVSAALVYNALDLLGFAKKIFG
ncbi:MAG: LysE family transporter [Pelolinea sp.]|nr:LysE family transporter [Pelolinea sp.]